MLVIKTVYALEPAVYICPLTLASPLAQDCGIPPLEVIDKLAYIHVDTDMEGDGLPDLKQTMMV